MGLILKEEEVNGVYTVTITGFCSDGFEIQYKSQFNFKSFSESLRDKIKSIGLGVSDELIALIVKDKVPEAKKELIQNCRLHFNERLNFENSHLKK